MNRTWLLVGGVAALTAAWYFGFLPGFASAPASAPAPGTPTGPSDLGFALTLAGKNPAALTINQAIVAQAASQTPGYGQLTPAQQSQVLRLSLQGTP